MIKKLLIGSLVLIAIILGSVYVMLQKLPEAEKSSEAYAQNIREEVLNFLESESEFCEIMKDDIQLDEGEFWLFCNERPFYATYENGNVSYELNGWDWLKNTEHWDELKDCNHYKSLQDSLIFFCPKIIEGPITAKIYSFDRTTFKLEKIEDKEFSTVLIEDIKNRHEFLNQCTLSDFKVRPPATPLIKFDCSGTPVITSVLLYFNYMSLPFFNVTGLGLNEKLELSFNKVFGEKCQINSITIETVEGSEINVIRATCSDFNAEIRYQFEPFYFSRYVFSTPSLDDEKMRIFVKEFGSKSLLVDVDELKLIKPPHVLEMLEGKYKMYDSGIIVSSIENRIGMCFKRGEWTDKKEAWL